ncbi:FAD-dependent oxidoreductase [Tanticharoenia sakaeratensis]|uniref:Rubredoxin-NAD(+) reductase n=1 Tax=Tanticharoenia sakaeratensis NBRC 103193 TaxID=1231623 RepID=A0A0D6ML30_9PROT|nr:FAD-dependent oxidoreductase [Tanticharoenia sakaeratensis]GAN54186.1 rubredoxin-NAD(+) reductase [Tanticharoenia sakaeratensis NBRC 103193]GBQ19352.1 rubredoxin-NAD reductase [Tanticharoenia sakaeratensis NBRC 103193]
MIDTSALFHDVIAEADVAPGQIAGATIGDRKVALIRDGETIRAFKGTCPHKGAPMEQGALCAAGDESWLVCPWHKAAFNAADGALREPLALDPLPQYPVQVVDGRVLVALTEIERAEPARCAEQKSVLILGAGAAGVAAACALREKGFAGKITMVSAEATAPYDRTALSKMTIGKDDPKASAPPLRSVAFYEENRITRITGRITAFDAASRTATLESGDRLQGDDVIIATGSVARTIDVPGADLPGVLTLRTQEDATQIIETVDPAGSVVVIGASFIGMEAASALRQRGVGVTVVGQTKVPFEKQFGREIGERLRALHAENGVAFIGGRSVERIQGQDRVSGVVLDDGTELRADAVLVGIGARPSLDAFTRLSHAEDGGLRVDSFLRVADHVHAVGDIASMSHDGHPVRIEHWRTAQAQARIAAAAILDETPPALPTPWFWTQQHGKKLEYLGWPDSFDAVDIDGSLQDFDFLAILRQKGRAVGLVGAGRAAVMAQAAVDFDSVAQDS